MNLIPRSRSTGLATWVGGVLDRLAARFGPLLRAAIAAPVPSLDQVPAARSEVDRVLDRPMGPERVTSLTQSRTPVLSGEIADLVRSRAELRDPRVQVLFDYDQERGAALVDTLERYLHASAMSGRPPPTCTSTRTRCAIGSAGPRRSSASFSDRPGANRKDHEMNVETVDYHTAGEPFRIARPQATIPGATVAERRVFAIGNADLQALRRFLCFEPRGHADMYGGLLVPPDDDAAHLGVLFWHKDGFSTACGHGTMALGAWAIHTGLVTPDPSGVTDVRIDVPSGRVTARVRTEGDQVVGVDFVNVPSYVLHRDVPVSTSRGEVSVDIAYGGAIYAHLDASRVGLRVTPENYADLIVLGREVKHLLNATDYAVHPDDNRLSGIYGTILFDDLGATDDGNLRQRNVTVFADGEVDRSPCGSGTASRVALLAATGALADPRQLIHESIVGTVFRARVGQHVEAAGRPAVVPEVSGMAYRTGRHVFELDPADTLGAGFVLR